MKRRMKMNSSNKRRRGRSLAGLMMTSTIAHHQNMATTTSKEGRRRTMMTITTNDDGNWCNGKEEDGNLGDPHRRNHSHHSSPSARMFQEDNYNNQLERPQKSSTFHSDKAQRLWMQRDIKSTTMQMRKTFNLICLIAILLFMLLQASQIAVDAAGQVVIKRFSKEQCKFNPCLNGGKCIAGKTSCECPSGWMGKYCHRRCRNIYQSCDRWAMEEKCELVRTQTNFFDINCAVSCKLCTPDPSVKLTPIPLPPALEPLQFMMGKWYSQATKGLRYPTDMLSSEYEELLDISPTQVPMFGPPSLNLTSTCWYTDGAHDVRITHGFITLKPNSNPPEIAILSTANEGLNMIELGTLQNHAVTLNISYMQVHPSLDNDVLPLGATRRFKRTGQFLEMTVAKLFPGNKVSQFKKMFKKVRNYPF